jgi:hypothetical protein
MVEKLRTEVEKPRTLLGSEKPFRFPAPTASRDKFRCGYRGHSTFKSLSNSADLSGSIKLIQTS